MDTIIVKPRSCSEYKEVITLPFQGTSLGNNCYQVRLAVASKGRGKSGGARVLHSDKTTEKIVVISIYDKSELATISDKEIKERLKRCLA